MSIFDGEVRLPDATHAAEREETHPLAVLKAESLVDGEEVLVQQIQHVVAAYEVGIPMLTKHETGKLGSSGL
jgi:hypothetical protein